MFEKNTKQVNQIIVKIFAVCRIAIALVAIGSYVGFFEFESKYTLIVLIAELVVTISSGLLMRILSPLNIDYWGAL